MRVKNCENTFRPCHRLNGSSSHCVNGDFSFLWESQKFDPHRIKTPDLIEIKFCTVDYVSQMTPHAKFHVNLHKENFSAALQIVYLHAIGLGLQKRLLGLIFKFVLHYIVLNIVFLFIAL